MAGALVQKGSKGKDVPGIAVGAVTIGTGATPSLQIRSSSLKLCPIGTTATVRSSTLEKIISPPSNTIGRLDERAAVSVRLAPMYRHS
jgi:hypothetical protein